MCGSTRLALAALAGLAGLAGCALSLDDEYIQPSPPLPPVPEPPSCPVLGGATGRVRSFIDGAELRALADELDGAGPVMLAAGGACLDAAGPASPSLFTSGGLLDVFERGDERFAYAEVDGGVALTRWDGVGFAMVEPLFTADRPRYGDAALVDGDTLYAYGCAAAGFLAEDCFVARVPVAHAGDRTAYEFYIQGGLWSANPDDAWPIFSGGGGLAVRRRRDRVVAAYARPLGDTLEIRVGLAPDGPWSAPVAAARCELPTDAFCSGVSFHPSLDVDSEHVALTYAIRSFEPLVAEDRVTRLVNVAVEDLP